MTEQKSASLFDHIRSHEPLEEPQLFELIRVIQNMPEARYDSYGKLGDGSVVIIFDSDIENKEKIATFLRDLNFNTNEITQKENWGEFGEPWSCDRMNLMENTGQVLLDWVGYKYRLNIPLK